MKSARLPATALPKTRSPRLDCVAPAPKKSDARPMATRTRPAAAAASSSAVIAARARPLDVVAASGGASVIGLPPAGPLGCGQHAPLQRREKFRPLGVRGVEALVDHRCALSRVAGRIEVGGVRGPPVHVVSQSCGPAARDGPDREIQPGQPVREGETHLPGAENDVQAALTHRVAPARSRYVQAVPIVLFLCWLTDLTFRSVT